jgi:hypothetical protein
MSDNATRVDLARNEPLEFELPEFTMKQSVFPSSSPRPAADP